MTKAALTVAARRASTNNAATTIAARRTTAAAARPKTSARCRQIIHDNHAQFSRGAPPPPGIHLVRGQPLPHGYYGERLDNRSLPHLPYYQGYEWPRSGPEVVLIAVGTASVYEILDGVLN